MYRMNKFFVLPMFAALLVAGSSVFAEDRPRSVDLACMKAAVEKREDAIIASKEKAFASYDAAFKARRASLSTAWTIAVVKDRRVAINAAWATFRTSHKDARTQLREEDKALWSTFKTDSKVCKVDSASIGSDRAGEKIDRDTL